MRLLDRSRRDQLTRLCSAPLRSLPRHSATEWTVPLPFHRPMSICPLEWNDPRPYSALSGMEQSFGGVGFQRADLAEQETEPAIVGRKMGLEPPTHVCRMSTVRASLHAAMLPVGGTGAGSPTRASPSAEGTRHAHDGLVERRAPMGPVEAGVAVGEDAAIRGHQPVAPAVGCGRHAHDRLVQR